MTLKKGQGHGVQHWQCRSKIAHVKIYQRHLHFLISSTFDLCERFLHPYTHTELIKSEHLISHATIWKSRSRSKSITSAMMPLDGKYWNLQMSCVCTLALVHTIFVILTIYWPWRLGQGQRVQHSQWFYSMVNVEIYQCHLLQFCASFHRFRDMDSWSSTFEK